MNNVLHFGIYLKLSKINLQMLVSSKHLAFIVKERENTE